MITGYYQSTLPYRNTLSEASRQTYLLQQVVWNGMSANRLSAQAIDIAPVGNDVALAENLTSAQLMGIAGEDSTGMPVTSADLWAKVDTITGGTFAERLAISLAIRTFTFTDIAGQVIIGLITSSNIVIKLKAGHGLVALWFTVIPAQYIADPYPDNQT